jgi:hypothetical protein
VIIHINVSEPVERYRMYTDIHMLMYDAIFDWQQALYNIFGGGGHLKSGILNN